MAQTLSDFQLSWNVENVAFRTFRFGRRVVLGNNWEMPGGRIRPGAVLTAHRCQIVENVPCSQSRSDSQGLKLTQCKNIYLEHPLGLHTSSRKSACSNVTWNYHISIWRLSAIFISVLFVYPLFQKITVMVCFYLRLQCFFGLWSGTPGTTGLLYRSPTVAFRS